MKPNLKRRDHPLSFPHRPHRILIQFIPTIRSGGMNNQTHTQTARGGGGSRKRMLFELHILFFPFSQWATTLQVQRGDHPTALFSIFRTHLAPPCEHSLSTKHIHLLLFLAQTHTESVHKAFMCAWWSALGSWGILPFFFCIAVLSLMQTKWKKKFLKM